MSEPLFPNIPWGGSGEPLPPPPSMPEAQVQQPMRSAAAAESAPTQPTQAQPAASPASRRRRPKVSPAIPTRPTPDAQPQVGPVPESQQGAGELTTEQLMRATILRLQKEMWSGFLGPMWMDGVALLAGWLVLFSAQAKWLPEFRLLFEWPLFAAIATVIMAVLWWQMIRLGQRHQALALVIESDWAEHGRTEFQVGIEDAVEQLRKIRVASNVLRQALIALQMAAVAYFAALILH